MFRDIQQPAGVAETVTVHHPENNTAGKLGPDSWPGVAESDLYLVSTSSHTQSDSTPLVTQW